MNNFVPIFLFYFKKKKITTHTSNTRRYISNQVISEKEAQKNIVRVEPVTVGKKDRLKDV